MYVIHYDPHYVYPSALCTTSTHDADLNIGGCMCISIFPPFSPLSHAHAPPPQPHPGEAHCAALAAPAVPLPVAPPPAAAPGPAHARPSVDAVDAPGQFGSLLMALWQSDGLSMVYMSWVIGRSSSSGSRSSSSSRSSSRSGKGDLQSCICMTIDVQLFRMSDDVPCGLLGGSQWVLALVQPFQVIACAGPPCSCRP